MALGVALAMLAGGSCGGFTGKMRQWFRMPTIIAMPALFTALRRFANLITGGFPLTDLPDWFGFLGAGDLRGIRSPSMWSRPSCSWVASPTA